jgi:phospholipase C
MPTRRNFIKSAAMLSGAAGFAAGIPDSVQKAFAIEPDAGTTWSDAEHIVILMQENRSFDHALGTLQGVRGFNDPRAIRQANGNSIFLQTSIDGDTFAPWRLDIKDTKITWMGSISHERHTQVDAWNHGHHNAWIDAKRSHNEAYTQVPITMGHYTREDLPFYYALADAFTVCDQHYCGVMTSTTPNRSMFWTGTIRDAQNAHSAVYMRNPEYGHGKLKWTTYPERLQEAGIDWKIYQNELGLADLDEEQHAWLGNLGNMTESFAAYHVNLSDASMQKLQDRVDKAEKELADLKAAPLPVEPSMRDDHKAEIEQKETHLEAMKEQLKKGGGGLASLPADAQDLHRRAFVTNAGSDDYHELEAISFDDGGHTASMKVPKGDVFYQFRKDVNEGKLPTISWLSPPGKFSDHPSHPWYGAWYVSEVVDILTKNPEVWKKTIFILTYDENDGYFDHCPSFVAADPANKSTGRGSEGIDMALDYTYAADEIAQEVPAVNARSGPIGLGYRVPMIVASPWSRGGWVNSQVFEHTSTLQFLESYVQAKFGKTVQETNVTQFRRAISGNLTSIFRPADGGEKAKLPFLNRDKFVESIQQAQYKEIPSNYNKLSAKQMADYNKDPRTVANVSRQEPGIRQACALPYELYCEGDFHADHQAFGLAMRAGDHVHGAASAGAPFNVYIRNTAKGTGVLARGPNNTNMMVATYSVKPGDTLQEGIPLQIFADGKYEIDVHGPNGFYREFRGDATPSPIVSRCAYERNSGGLSGNVLASLKNVSTAPVTVTIADNSYKTGTQTVKLAPGQQMSVPVASSKSHGWYDYTVQAQGSNTHIRYAGRVETGRSSFTDPLMGGLLA